MKKNFIIGILSIISVSSVVFGIYQQTLANQLRIKAEAAAMEAMRQKETAEEMTRVAEQQRALAHANQMEALKQREIALRESNKVKH